MIGVEPLIIRRSRGNFGYLFNLAIAAAFLFYSFALFNRWPSVMGRNPEGDELVAGIAGLAGLLSLLSLTVRPLLDRAPLMIIDAAGVAPKETGGIPVPYREIGGYRFEKIQEGRSSYWYFLFSQTDAATGLEFNYKISADEFDYDNDIVERRIDLFSQAERKGLAPAKPRPASITFDFSGDALVANYALRKEVKSIVIYWLLALAGLAVLTYAAIVMNFGLRSLGLFVANPQAILMIKETWYWAIGAGIAALAAFGTLFRLRDIFFRPLGLRVDRSGITSPELGSATVVWGNISAIRFEPDATLHITVTGGDGMGERFLPIGRFGFSQQELFSAMAWLLARFKIKLQRMAGD